MDAATLVIWLMALVVGAIAYFRPGRLHVQGLKIGWELLLTMSPRVAMAIFIAGFFSELIPTDLVASWFGRESGVRGILLASLVGGFTPGGPHICFPIAIILFKSGAAVPPLVAYLTAWSLFAFHRIITWEIPLMGYRFMILRIVSSLALPPLAGILTAAVQTNVWTGM